MEYWKTTNYQIPKTMVEFKMADEPAGNIEVIFRMDGVYRARSYPPNMSNMEMLDGVITDYRNHLAAIIDEKSEEMKKLRCEIDSATIRLTDLESIVSR